MRRLSITVPTVAFSVVSNCPPPCTSIDSVTLPTSMEKLTRTESATCTFTPPRVADLNPVFSTRIR